MPLATESDPVLTSAALALSRRSKDGSAHSQMV
jgi:hypothetical protein